MKERIAAALTFIALTSLGGCFFLYKHPNAACRQLAEALNSKIETLRREAHEKLTVGTKKEDVIRFFAGNGIPLTYLPNEASGTLYVSGCSPSGCGNDNFLLGVRVKTDKAGTVISEPVVGGIYTDCL